MQKLEEIFLAINRYVLMFLLAAMSVIVFTNVLMRYFGGASLPWAEEVSRHMMIWLTFLGSGLVLRSGGHIAIDNLQDALPARQAFCVRLVVLVVMVCFLLMLAYYGWEYSMVTMTQTTAATEVPFGFIYLAMPAGCVLMLIHLAMIARQWLVSREFVAELDFDATASASV